MLASFSFWAVLIVGFLVVITILLPSMHPVDIFASLGIGSLAIGFVLKDILQNWIAGFLILLRRPFRRGDQIKVGEIEGHRAGGRNTGDVDQDILRTARHRAEHRHLYAGNDHPYRL
jgi:small-conductance mechanosensitive channel